MRELPIIFIQEVKRDLYYKRMNIKEYNHNRPNPFIRIHQKQNQAILKYQGVKTARPVISLMTTMNKRIMNSSSPQQSYSTLDIHTHKPPWPQSMITHFKYQTTTKPSKVMMKSSPPQYPHSTVHQISIHIQLYCCYPSCHTTEISAHSTHTS